MAPFNSAAEHCRRQHGWVASLRLHSARGNMFQRRTLPQRIWCLELAQRVGVMGHCCCLLRHCLSGCCAASSVRSAAHYAGA